MRRVQAEPVSAGVQSSGKSNDSTSGKKEPRTSGKLVANPEVETSGKSNGQNDLPLVDEDLPLTPDDDSDIQLEEEIDEEARGWRLEQNSNGYYRWRWQMKDVDNNPITYVNKSGNTGYKRGSKYVPIEEAKERL